MISLAVGAFFLDDGLHGSTSFGNPYMKSKKCYAVAGLAMVVGLMRVENKECS